MCVILICPPKVRPDLATLEACADANPHGGGIAWREGGLVHYRKVDAPGEVHRLAAKAKGEVVIHFRIASVGGVQPELRHPFPVTSRAGLADHGTAKAVLFQNGTWGDWRGAVAKAVRDGHRELVGPMSDARAAAWLVHLYGPAYLDALQPSRWVLFATDETLALGDWIVRCGIRFSNLSWCGRHTGPPPHLQTCPSPPPSAGNGHPKPRAKPAVVDLWGEHRDYWSRLMPKRA
jgi:hypothetical protein